MDRTLAFIVLAPLLGLILAYIIMTAIYWFFRRSSPKKMDFWFRRLQLVSAAIFSYAHGTNDAQKTMGIITGVLFAGGYLTALSVPVWVIFAAHTAIALGTLSGGWRIVHTMGSRLTKLKPRGGFAAETAAAVSILFSVNWECPSRPLTSLQARLRGWAPFSGPRPSDGGLPPRSSGHGF